MNLKDELLNVKVKTAKKTIKLKKTEHDTKSSVLPKIEIPDTEQPKPEQPKPERLKQKVKNIVITGQPEKKTQNTTDIVLMDFEITPEMAQATLEGLFETIHILAPKTFKSPEKRHIEGLKAPTTVVIKRWIKQVDILKYLPEIALAAGIIATLKDMRITEDKK